MQITSKAWIQAIVTLLFFDILAEIGTFLEAEFCRLLIFESRFGSFGWFDSLFAFFKVAADATLLNRVDKNKPKRQ